MTARRRGWWLVAGAALLAVLVVWLDGTSAASARVAHGRVTAADTTVPDTTVRDPTEADTTEADTTVTPWHEEAWSPITRVAGVRFDYIFYSKADNYHNGVVLRLRNTNAHPVRLDFTVVFRTPNEEATAEWAGSLEPGESQTGENDGLFWIPFKDGQSIGEVGLRGIDVRGE